MSLSQFFHTNDRFQSPLAILIQLARRHRYTYDDYHTFFSCFIALLDAGSSSLSMAEFSFYMRRLLQASVPINQAMDWCQGSLLDIDRHLSAMSGDDLICLADYVFSEPYARLLSLLIERRAMTPNKQTQARACVLIDITENFTRLLSRQLQSRNLLAKHHCLPKIIESPQHGNGANAQTSSMRVIVSELLSDEGFTRLEHAELAAHMTEGAEQY